MSMITSTASAGLNDRSLGWLRFLWDKATTEDDWSDQGEPHAWWDRYSEPPMCAFPRFDLAEMGYVLPMMLEATPAWREGYTRILDELLRRYVSFWGAIDWNTLIGPDPNVDKYPPEWLMVIPEHLRGRYAPPGWTGNGIEPWGLQPDPVGCDGNLFYRGWLNLVLGMRHYVSGDPAENSPFEVSGYQNRRFVWTHQRIAQLIANQLKARPQGAHCENTKIWPFCMSAAGLGFKLYDALLHTSTFKKLKNVPWSYGSIPLADKNKLTVGFGYASGQMRTTFQFNPAKLGQTGLSVLYAYLELILHWGWLSLLEKGRIRDVEIAVDINGAAFADYWFIDPRLSVSDNSYEQNGTTYLGSKGPHVSKLVLITGAAGGIGQATARRFAKSGWRVAITDIQQSELASLGTQLGKQLAASLTLDVRDAPAVKVALKSIARRNDGRLDLLVNNAGIAYLEHFEEKPLEFHHALEAVNIRGVLNCTYQAYPYLKAAGGRVVNLCSTSAIYGVPGMATYSASKFWVRGFTEALNLEWESQGIQVCDVMPSLVKTAMTHGIEGKLIKHFGIHLTPDDVAAAIFDAAHGRRVHTMVDKSFATKIQLRALSLLPVFLQRLAIKRAAIA